MIDVLCTMAFAVIGYATACVSKSTLALIVLTAVFALDTFSDTLDANKTFTSRINVITMWFALPFCQYCYGTKLGKEMDTSKWFTIFFNRVVSSVANGLEFYIGLSMVATVPCLAITALGYLEAQSTAVALTNDHLVVEDPHFRDMVGLAQQLVFTFVDAFGTIAAIPITTFMNWGFCSTFLARAFVTNALIVKFGLFLEQVTLVSLKNKEASVLHSTRVHAVTSAMPIVSTASAPAMKHTCKNMTAAEKKTTQQREMKATKKKACQSLRRTNHPAMANNAAVLAPANGTAPASPSPVPAVSADAGEETAAEKKARQTLQRKKRAIARNNIAKPTRRITVTRNTRSAAAVRRSVKDSPSETQAEKIQRRNEQRQKRTLAKLRNTKFIEREN